MLEPQPIPQGGGTAALVTHPPPNMVLPVLFDGTCIAREGESLHRASLESWFFISWVLILTYASFDSWFFISFLINFIPYMCIGQSCISITIISVFLCSGIWCCRCHLMVHVLQGREKVPRAKEDRDYCYGDARLINAHVRYKINQERDKESRFKRCMK